jgi:hypothetical protein
LKNTIIDNEQFTKHLIAKLPNWRYFFEILAKLGLIQRCNVQQRRAAVARGNVRQPSSTPDEPLRHAAC